MAKYLKDTYTVPPGGTWKFSDLDGVEITGGSFEQLVSKVLTHRKKHNQALGAPELEVQVQICERHPSYCADELRGLGDAVEMVAKPIARMIDRVAGTSIVKCKSCQKRRKYLNELGKDF